MPWAWFGLRVAVASAVAEASVVWLTVEALSPEDVGPIALWPVVVALLVLAIVPPLLAGRGAIGRSGGVLATLVAVGVMVKGLALPSIGWLDDALPGAALDSLLLRDGPAVMPVWVPLLLAVAAAWWRARLGGDATEDVALTLRVGAVALGLFATVGLFTDMASETDAVTAALLFFGGSLLAMGWARQATVHPGGPGGGSTVASIATLGAVVTTLAVATALVALVTPAAFDALVTVLTPLIWLVRGALLVLGALVLLILYPVFWLINRFLVDRGAEDPPPPDASDTLLDQASQQPDPSSLVVPDEVRLALAVVALVVLAVIALRIVARRVVVATGPPDVEQHVEFDPRALLRRRRPPVPPTERDPLAELRGDDRFRYTVAIRETYRRFLEASAVAGLARRPGEPPRRHADRVARRLGVPTIPVQTLAGDWAPRRYGDEPATADEWRAVETVWATVRPALTDLAASANRPK